MEYFKVYIKYNTEPGSGVFEHIFQARDPFSARGLCEAQYGRDRMQFDPVPLHYNEKVSQGLI